MKAYKLVLTLAIAGLVIQGPFAYADAETFESAKSGDWDKPATWDCPGGECDHPYPVAGDTATVLQDHVVDVDNPQAVTTLTVNMKTDGTAGGVLDMQANARLDILASLTVQADATDPGVFRFSATSGDTPELRAAVPTVTIFGLIHTTGSQGATISARQRRRGPRRWRGHHHHSAHADQRDCSGYEFGRSHFRDERPCARLHRLDSRG